jgi:hypothetical protein
MERNFLNEYDVPLSYKAKSGTQNDCLAILGSCSQIEFCLLVTKPQNWAETGLSQWVELFKPLKIIPSQF